MSYNRSGLFSLRGESQEMNNTRFMSDPLNIGKPRAHLDLWKHFFSIRVVDQWNSLPSSIKSGTFVNSFKNAYETYLKGKKLKYPQKKLKNRSKKPEKNIKIKACKKITKNEKMKKHKQLQFICEYMLNIAAAAANQH